MLTFSPILTSKAGDHSRVGTRDVDGGFVRLENRNGLILRYTISDREISTTVTSLNRRCRELLFFLSCAPHRTHGASVIT